MGPVTIEEYESRQDRYDTELTEKYETDVSEMDTEQKVKTLRENREAQYVKLVDAVYLRRGWTENGIPTVETVKRLGLASQEIMELLKANGVK
jgi:aldehyde:ferredoxin oxidoreductase